MVSYNKGIFLNIWEFSEEGFRSMEWISAGWKTVSKLNRLGDAHWIWIIRNIIKWWGFFEYFLLLKHKTSKYCLSAMVFQYKATQFYLSPSDFRSKDIERKISISPILFQWNFKVWNFILKSNLFLLISNCITINIVY